MLNPRGAALRDVLGLLNWEHWESWSCMGAGRARGWAGCLADVVGARSAFGGALRALCHTPLFCCAERGYHQGPPCFTIVSPF